MRKLSKAQHHVVDRLASGWELGFSLTGDSYCWIQCGGVGRGGERERVSCATFAALRRLGIIELRERAFPNAKYHLTAKAAGGDDASA